MLAIFVRLDFVPCLRVCTPDRHYFVRRRVLLNPLEFRGNYSATSNNNEVGTLAVDGWALIFSTERRGRLSPPPSLYQM